MFAFAGCGNDEEKKTGEVTLPPVEALTEMPEPPEEATPTEGAENTVPGQTDEENPYGIRFTGKDETEEIKDGDVIYFKSAIHYHET